ncbi:hypothetical protein GCM10022198_00100 [Klugiella xanthotipulae]|uniref:N-acetylmuramoyl-L-alanine amidase n=1 Tax=Klugiella xanthotipulae TaxID=244735 RepID=A0A543I5J2_9MICO|nr:N-acetylmuramoyl-L-alanine amidase [Klugiella xanthotipulae]TQM65849.1 N-acetylmuramoyl-L-alanine amidase [Klugiella xanthotipulae]
MKIRTVRPDPRKYTPGRPNGKPNLFVIHHQAGYQENSIRVLTTGQGAPSASYIISEGDVVASVPEGDTPWTNNNWASNTRSITFELANSPGMAPPSRGTLESAAQVMAAAARRWGYTVPLTRANVKGHNEVADKPTACPGGTDLGWLIARANQILTGTSAPSVAEQVKALVESGTMYARIVNTNPAEKTRWLINLRTAAYAAMTSNEQGQAALRLKLPTIEITGKSLTEIEKVRQSVNLLRDAHPDLFDPLTKAERKALGVAAK